MRPAARRPRLRLCGNRARGAFVLNRRVVLPPWNACSWPGERPHRRSTQHIFCMRSVGHGQLCYMTRRGTAGRAHDDSVMEASTAAGRAATTVMENPMAQVRDASRCFCRFFDARAAPGPGRRGLGAPAPGACGAQPLGAGACGHCRDDGGLLRHDRAEGVFPIGARDFRWWRRERSGREADGHGRLRRYPSQ